MHTHTCSLHIYTYTPYITIHTHSVLHQQNITTMWLQQSINQGLYMLCTCPASLPIEHASSGRQEHRLTGSYSLDIITQPFLLAYINVHCLHRPEYNLIDTLLPFNINMQVDYNKNKEILANTDRFYAF